MEIYCLRNERNDKVACGLCSMFREEKHDFSLSGGAKAEAVIESSDAKTYYETFEKAAAAVSQNDTLKLCFDADCEDGYCDYCNEKFAANVANADGAAYKYYTDINEAVKAQLEFGNSYTVKLLSDFPISIPLEFTEGSPRIDLNGHSVDNMWLKLDCRATILGDGTLNYLTISNNAGLTAATPVVNVLWIADGATWSSILPDASFGDKVYNRDMSSYKWYESGSVGEIAIEKEMEGQSDKTYQIFRAGIQPLPIKEAPILMLGGVPLEDGRVVRTDEKFKFSVKLGNEGATCTVHHGISGGETMENEPLNIYSSGVYEPEFNKSFNPAGTYQAWAEVTKDGYTRTTDKFTVAAAFG